MEFAEKSATQKILVAIGFAMVCLWLLVPCVGNTAEEERSTGPVLTPKSEKSFQRLDARLAETLPEGWSTLRLSIEKDRVVIRFSGPGTSEVVVSLLHPSRYWPGDRWIGGDSERLFALRCDSKQKGAKIVLDALERAFGSSEHLEDYWTQRASVQKSTLEQSVGAAIEKLLNSGNFEIAEDLIRALRFQSPENVEALVLDLRLGIERGDADVETKLRQLLERFDGQAKSSVQMESVRLALKNGTVPLVSLEDVARGSSDVCRPLSLLSTLQRIEETQVASRVPLLLDAARAYSDCEAFDRALSKIMVERNLGKELVELARIRLQKTPESPEWLVRQATGYRLLKQFDKALEAYEKIQKIDPGRDDVISAYSTVCASHPDPDAVDRRLAARLKADPNDRMARHAQAVCHYYRHEFEQVIPLTDRLEKEMPENSRVWVYGGMSRYELGDSKGARVRIERLPKLPNMDKDYYYCSAILSQQHDLGRAKTMLRRYIDAPHTPLDRAEKIDFARDALRRLESGKIVEEWLPLRQHDIAMKSQHGGPDSPTEGESSCRSAQGLAGWFGLILILGFGWRRARHS